MSVYAYLLGVKDLICSIFRLHCDFQCDNNVVLLGQMMITFTAEEQ